MAAISVFFVLLVAGAIAAISFLGLAVASSSSNSYSIDSDATSKPDSDYAKYRYAAVTTNSNVCSKIGL